MFHGLDGNKRRHQLSKRIAAEKKALEDAITEYNAIVREADRLPPPNQLIADDDYSWQWEVHIWKDTEYKFADAHTSL